MTAIFISHSGADNAAAAEMKRWLEAEGHTSLFLDFDPEAGIKAGSDWEQTLYRQLRQCRAVIALLTPNWLASKWCFAELVQARERGKAIFPVKVKPCEAGGVFSDIQHIDLVAQPEEGYRRLKIGLPTDVFDWDPKRPLYPGLLAFQEQDAAIFFGRSEDILKTLETLDSLRRQGSEAARFALLLGASGSGKSSLARAGVIPRLKKKPAEWLPIQPFRPQVEPLAELAMALAAAFEAQRRGREWSAIRAELTTAAAQTPVDGLALLGLARDLAIAAGQPETTVLLIIDQAEELFGYTPSEAATRFLRLLRAGLEAGDRRLMAVATLRSDFLGEFQNHPVLQDSEYPHHFRYLAVPVDPMPLRSFPEIIQGPARLAGLQLDDGLIEAMVNDTGTRDALPLLAFTLRRLYERFGGDGRLTLDEYESLGRLEGAVREEAQRIIAEANPNQEDLEALHAAFVPSMVRINAEGGYARRRALLDDLPQRARPLLRRFVDARLLVTDRDPQGEETIEVAHEALLRTWPRLSDWLIEDRDKLRLFESLQRAAEEWDQGGRRDDLLVRGRLRDAEVLLADPRFTLSEVGRAYLDACSAAQRAHEAAEKEEQERRIRDAERIAEEQKKAAAAEKRTARFALVAVAVFVLVAALAGWQWWRAEKQRQAAVARQLAVQARVDLDSLPQRSLLLAIESISKEREAGSLHTATAGQLLRDVLTATGGRSLGGHAKSTRVAAFSVDRHWLATGSDDGTIRLWDLNTPDPTSRSFLLDGHQGAVHGLAFSPDGAWLVSGAADGAVRLWRLTAEGANAGPVFSGGRYGAIHAVAISPKGDWLVFGTQSGNVCIWKMSAEGPLETPCEAWKDEDPVMNVVFSAKGRWLATTCTGACKEFGAKVRLWDLSADFPNQGPKRLSHATELAEASLSAIAFTGDETRLAVAYGYVAEVWDLTQENPPQHVDGTYPGSGGWILTVGLSPDNRWLATGSLSGSDVKLWDLTKARKEPIVLKGHSAAVRSVVFSDDSRWLATGADNSARLWDLADPCSKPATLLRGQDLPMGKVIFSPGAEPRHLVTVGVTVGDEPHARLWNIPDSSTDPIVLRGQVKPLIIGMAVSPDGKWIATSSAEDPKLVLWSTKDLRQPARELPLPSASHAIAFSPDGRWLAAKSQDKGVVSLWNFADLSKPPLELFEHGWGDVRSLGFSPDSRWLVSGTVIGDWEKGIVNMWEVSSDNPSLEPQFSCQQDAVRGNLAFSSDGRYVATAAHGFTARLWDLTSPNPCNNSRVLGPHGDVVYQVAFSTDARWAATASADGKGRLWDLKVGSEPKLISELEFKDRVLQASFSPDNRWVAFGSWDRTVKLLDLENSGASKPIELSGHAGRISSVSFSPDSRWLAAGSEDRTVRLWDSTNPTVAPIILRGHEANVAHIGFSKDSRWIITGAHDGTIRLWRLKLTDLVGIACQTAGRDLTPEEAKDFLGEEDAQRPCTDQQIVDLPGPDDAPKVAAVQGLPDAAKAPPGEQGAAPIEAPGPGISPPEPQPSKPAAPAPPPE